MTVVIFHDVNKITELLCLLCRQNRRVFVALLMDVVVIVSLRPFVDRVTSTDSADHLVALLAGVRSRQCADFLKRKQKSNNGKYSN